MLATALEVLVDDPSATTAKVAEATGTDPAELARRYPTREALLAAVAGTVLEDLERTITDALTPERAPMVSLRALVEGMVLIGPQLEFLMRQPALDADDDVQARWEAADGPIEALVEKLAADGLLREGMAPWWVSAQVYGLAHTAWEGVATERFTPEQAAEVAWTTLRAGVAG